jgi:hypothetical protein
MKDLQSATAVHSAVEEGQPNPTQPSPSGTNVFEAWLSGYRGRLDLACGGSPQPDGARPDEKQPKPRTSANEQNMDVS